MPTTNAILTLLKPFVEKGIILPRSRQSIQSHLAEFITIEKDKNTIACAGLKIYSNNFAEIYALAIDAQYQGQGYSVALLSQLSQKAKSKKINRLFALSKYQYNWFLKHNFDSVALSAIPIERQKEFDSQRNPNIFIKKL